MNQSANEQYTFVIEPTKGWQFLKIRELWQARELLAFMAWRDIKVRYKQTFLGATWAILQPAMMMVVFTVLFNKLAKVDSGSTPYPLFVYCGLLPWTFFSTAMANAANSVIGSERLITKIYFPRLLVPYSAVVAAAVDFMIALVLLAGMMVWYQVSPGWNILFVPLIFLLIGVAALGVGTGLSAMNVSYRDFRYIVPFIVQIGMFATPAIFFIPKTEGSGWIQTLINLNPMNTFVSSFRASILNEPIQWSQLAIASGIAFLFFILGSFYFRKVEDHFADII